MCLLSTTENNNVISSKKSKSKITRDRVILDSREKYLPKLLLVKFDGLLIDSSILNYNIIKVPVPKILI